VLTYIIAIPAFWAAYLAMAYSPQRAFLTAYIPILFLLPDYYYWVLPVLPDPSFNQAVLMAIFGVWLMRGRPHWKSSSTDYLVYGYCISTTYSEYSNAGFDEALNLGFDAVASILVPYIMAKALIEPCGLRFEFAKSVVWSLFIISILSVFQFFSGAPKTLWQIMLAPFFPGQGWQWVTSFRWGLARVSGPYGHAILAGIIMVVGYRIQRWLHWSGAWTERIKWIAWIPLKTETVLSIGLFAGALMTLVRGPLIGGVFGAIIVMIGRSTQRWLILYLTIAAVIIIGIPFMNWFIGYASVGREAAATESQETIAYRWELIGTYINDGIARMWFGWGRSGWPKNPYQPSIDNYYLLLFLMHGLVSILFLLAIMLGMIVRLFIHDMFRPVPKRKGSALGFTLMSLYVVFGWSIATVYMGEQTIPLLFLLVGWSEGYLMYSKQEHLFYPEQFGGNNNSLENNMPSSPSRFKFKRYLE
jgi:hypothetical protein